jgi:transcription elongation factor Elf1
MSGDHNMHQKPRSYLDDFECPRCGHCCKTDLARVGEVGVWGEWQGLTDEEINSVRYKRDWTAPWSDTTFARAIEAKLKEKNT